MSQQTTTTGRQTPVPWHLVEEAEYINIEGPNDEPICIINLDLEESDDSEKFNAEHVANAERIVKAVNSHDDLLAALKDLVDEMGLTLHATGWDGSTTMRSLGRAKAAIAKAGA